MTYDVHALLQMASQGVWERVIHAEADETEIKHVLIDSTIVRARGHSDAVIALRRSLCMETGLAVVILAAVAWLGVLSPPGT